MFCHLPGIELVLIQSLLINLECDVLSMALSTTVNKQTSGFRCLLRDKAISRSER